VAFVFEFDLSEYEAVAAVITVSFSIAEMGAYERPLSDMPSGKDKRVR